MKTLILTLALLIPQISLAATELDQPLGTHSKIESLDDAQNTVRQERKEAARQWRALIRAGEEQEQMNDLAQTGFAGPIELNN